MNNKKPDLRVAKDTVEFIERLLNPDGKPSELYKEVSKVLRSVEEGFSEPNDFHSKEEPEVFIYEGAFKNCNQDWLQISKEQYDNWKTIEGCTAVRRLKVDGFDCRVNYEREVLNWVANEVMPSLRDMVEKYGKDTVVKAMSDINWRIVL